MPDELKACWYEVVTGKFGCYFVETTSQRELTLDEVCALLNTGELGELRAGHTRAPSEDGGGGEEWLAMCGNAQIAAEEACPYPLTQDVCGKPYPTVFADIWIEGYTAALEENTRAPSDDGGGGEVCTGSGRADICNCDHCYDKATQPPVEKPRYGVHKCEQCNVMVQDGNRWCDRCSSAGMPQPPAEQEGDTYEDRLLREMAANQIAHDDAQEYCGCPHTMYEEVCGPCRGMKSESGTCPECGLKVMGHGKWDT